jgi:hypothetical protein
MTVHVWSTLLASTRCDFPDYSSSVYAPDQGKSRRILSGEKAPSISSTECAQYLYMCYRDIAYHSQSIPYAHVNLTYVLYRFTCLISRNKSPALLSLTVVLTFLPLCPLYAMYSDGSQPALLSGDPHTHNSLLSH